MFIYILIYIYLILFYILHFLWWTLAKELKGIENRVM